MCGIAGYISDRLNKDDLIRMCNRIQHRGPDANGYFIDKNIGLGHLRLSIIDLSENANQPFFSSDRQWVIVYNGEVYNYKEIRNVLEGKGRKFRSGSDTEVILQAFEEYGPDAIKKFIGMFAFAIYHIPSQTLYLYRDRVGVKPLYYYKKEEEIWFCSELKGIAQQLAEKEVDVEAVADFFRFGYVRCPQTIYKNVYKLPPGHYLKISKGRSELCKYWDLDLAAHNLTSNIKSEGEAIEQLDELMTSSFNYRMVADVPVGVFLSGGIDSSLLTAILSKGNANLKTFSMGFDDEKYNEAPYAKQVAAFLGTDHHEQILTAIDANRVLDHYFEIYDEPFADSSGIPVFLISQFAKHQGCKVVLSADGGDELFGGYGRYQSLPTLRQKFSKVKGLNGVLPSMVSFIGKLPDSKLNLKHRTAKLQDLLTGISNNNPLEIYTSFLSVMPSSHLKKLINYTPLPENEYGELPLEEQMMWWDFKNYLPDDLLTKVDRATMAVSIEAREPFLDHRLVEFAFGLPLQWRMKPGFSKYLLKKTLYKYVPESYFDRKKMGFSIPLFKWFVKRLDKEFQQWFTFEKLAPVTCLDAKQVLKEYDRYRYFKSISKEHNILLMWHYYVFIKWWYRWMERN
jgi:asparagine synthase (glutamine-hydrolysing)